MIVSSLHIQRSQNAEPTRTPSWGLEIKTGNFCISVAPRTLDTTMHLYGVSHAQKEGYLSGAEITKATCRKKYDNYQSLRCDLNHAPPSSPDHVIPGPRPLRPIRSALAQHVRLAHATVQWFLKNKIKTKPNLNKPTIELNSDLSVTFQGRRQFVRDKQEM